MQDDFKAQQFTMDANGAIFLVDGPRLLANAPLRRAMVNSWGRWPEKKHMNTYARACERDADCPYTYYLQKRTSMRRFSAHSRTSRRASEGTSASTSTW